MLQIASANVSLVCANFFTIYHFENQVRIFFFLFLFINSILVSILVLSADIELKRARRKEMLREIRSLVVPMSNIFNILPTF